MEIKKFPDDLSGAYELIDKQDPYRILFQGLYQRSIPNGENTEQYYVYIPQKAYHSDRAVLIVMDRESSVDECLKKTGWLDIAEKDSVILFLAKGNQGEAYYHKFFEERRDQKYYTINKAVCYLVGYGTGSLVVQKEIVNRPQLWAGAVCFQNFGLDQEYLVEIGSQESDVSFVKKNQVPMPLWLWTDEMTKTQEQVVHYWKEANQIGTEEYIDETTIHYHPAANTLNSLINEQTGADLYVTVDVGRSFETPECTSRIWESFLSRTIRTVAIYNGDLRPYRTAEDWHAQRQTIDLGGYCREWYEYIPTAAKRNPDQKIPLVVCFHGGDNNGFTAMYRTEWIKVAECRNFAVVFPTGALRRRAEKNAVPHPAWNACGAQDIEDDVTFVRTVIENIEGRYAIDASRIYATGHSMGACMCQRVLLTMPEIFAAGAATGGVLKGGFFGYYDSPGVVEGYKMPIWIILGENDRGGGDFATNEKARLNIEYWTERNETSAWDDSCDYTDGLYWNKVYLDPVGVPFVRFTTVQYKPHTSIPQDSWFFYDEFFSKFSRNEAGESVYMKKIIVKN